MLPAQLKASDFAGYPAQARALAEQHLPLLQQLPLLYLVVVLREVAGYDWKLPAEKRRISGQLLYLSQLQKEKFAALFADFSAMKTGPTLDHSPWAANPAASVEQMTAWLWSSHQMEAFRAAAESLSNALAAAVPARLPSQHRLGIVVVGQGTAESSFPLFRKLRPHGVLLRNVSPGGGLDLLLAEAQHRAANSATTDSGKSAPMLHWYIEGGASLATSGLTQVSYAALEPARMALLKRTQQVIESGGAGPEGLRSLLAQMRPEEVGLGANTTTHDADPVLQHFQMSLLTEGSGTQIFATTFVQWAARECLRRAEPETLLLRYAPRQRQQPMNAMLSGAAEAGPDPAGSLIDADMGAYYTWLNMRRLPGAEQMRFLVWYEDHHEALAIGPGLPGGTSTDSTMDMRAVLKLLA